MPTQRFGGMPNEAITWDFLERVYGLKPIRGGSGEGEGGDGSGGDGAGAGDGGGANDGGNGSGGGNDDLTNQLAGERSANKLIKDFAKARGLTVSKLFETFETAENAQKSELQKAQDAIKAWEDKATTFQQRARDKAGRSAALDAATKANAISPKAVYAIVRDGIDYDDDDEPTNLDALIAQAKKDEPDLFRAAAGSGDGGRGGNGKAHDPNDQINAFLRASR